MNDDDDFDFNSTRVYVRMAIGLKTDAAKVFSQLGISMSEGIRIYLKQVIVQKEIPFKITLSPYPFRDPYAPDTKLEELLKSFEENKAP